MNKVLAVWLVALGIAFSTTLAAQTASAPPPDPPAPAAGEELETLLVVGEQPGPGLWKVSRGDHVMWILGTWGPLPKDIQWRSKDVEARIAESQEVLYRGFAKVGADISLFRGITLLPAAFKAAKNPNGATLKEILSAETYAKWTLLREKYIGDDKDIEKWRPTFALEELRSTAERKSGLRGSIGIESVVNKMARKHKVRIHKLPTVERKVPVENPRKILKSARNVELDDIECFTRSLERVESDIEAFKQGANAWSTGDMDSLRKISASLSLWGYSCMGQLTQAVSNGALADGDKAKKALEEMDRQSQVAMKEVEQDWLEAVDAALAANRSTFALLPMRLLLRPDGYVAKLRAKGYEVEEPL